MMNYFCQRISLGNLSNKSRGGQISTLLILIMVVFLIFIVVTVNIGKVSLTTTILSNAADAAVLLMASHLSSKANFLYNTKIGKGKDDILKTGTTYSVGFLPEVLGTAAAVILVAICIATGQPEAIPYAIVIGQTVGRGVGKGIRDGSLEAGMTGALEGFGIGMACIAGGGPAGMAVTSGLTTIATVINSYINQNIRQDEMEGMARDLTALSEIEAIRESTFYLAFAQTVDDPQLILDDSAKLFNFTDKGGYTHTVTVGPDIDSDGITDEKMPFFSYWWQGRIKMLKEWVEKRHEMIYNFQELHVKPINNYLKGFLPDVDRKEIECDCNDNEIDGKAIWFLRSLEKNYDQGHGYDVTFWRPGPDLDKLVEYLKTDCKGTGCPDPPEGFDEVDWMHLQLDKLVELANWISEQPIGKLDKNYTWLDLLYKPGNDPSTDPTFYDYLTEISKRIDRWVEELLNVPQNFPGCQLRYSSTPVKFNIPNYKKNKCETEEDDIKFSCNWEKAEDSITGVYFPNPICSLNDGNRAILKAEIDAVRDYVKNNLNNLEDYIRNNFSFNACPGGYHAHTNTLDVRVRKVGLDANLHSRGSDIPLETGNGTLRYEYSWRYQCHKRHKHCHSCSYHSHHSYPSGIRSGSVSVDQPDLHIPLMEKSQFLDILDEFTGLLDHIETTSPERFLSVNENVDSNYEDYQWVMSDLRTLQNKINDFLIWLKNFGDKIIPLITRDGADKLTYDWTDSLGRHDVTVETGPCLVPGVKFTEDQGKDRLDLINYKDNGERAWVTITRRDPANNDMGILGIWNPFDWDGDGFTSIKKSASAYYSTHVVGLKSKAIK